GPWGSGGPGVGPAHRLRGIGGGGPGAGSPPDGRGGLRGAARAPGELPPPVLLPLRAEDRPTRPAPVRPGPLVGSPGTGEPPPRDLPGLHSGTDGFGPGRRTH